MSVKFIKISEAKPSEIAFHAVPVMREAVLRKLPYIELHAISLNAGWLLSSGFWRHYGYDESYLNTIRDIYREKYNQVVEDGYNIIEDGVIVARLEQVGHCIEIVFI